MSDIKETNSGVRKKGDWKEVAEFGEEVEKEMEQSPMNEESVKEFEDWRPKSTEAENDIKKKTVEKASMNEKKVEQETDTVAKDMVQASGKVREAGKKAASGKNPGSELSEASLDVLKSFAARSTGLARELEKRIYSGIMLKFNPFYLDTDDFTVDFRAKKDGDYEMDVNLNEKESREKIQEHFDDEE